MEVNKIIHGSCYEGLAELENNSIDLLVTDPPYRFNMGGGGAFKTRKHFKAIEKAKMNVFNPKPFLSLVKKKLKKMNAYIFCSKGLLGDYLKFVKENNYNWQLLVMNKRNPIPTKNNKYLSDLEYIFFIRDKGAYFNNDLDYGNYYSFKTTTVSTNKYHPTQKPLNIIRGFIKTSSKKGDIILDPYMGSGTTAVACLQTGRKFLGWEKKRKHYVSSHIRLSTFDKKYLMELKKEERPKQKKLL